MHDSPSGHVFCCCACVFLFYITSLCHLLVQLSQTSSAKVGWIAASQKALLLCLAQEKCTHGVTTMRANLETGPLMPSRGHGWSLRCRARKSTGWPVVLLTPSHGPPASPPMLGNCLRRYCIYFQAEHFLYVCKQILCPHVPVDGSKALPIEA